MNGADHFPDRIQDHDRNAIRRFDSKSDSLLSRDHRIGLRRSLAEIFVVAENKDPVAVDLLHRKQAKTLKLLTDDLDIPIHLRRPVADCNAEIKIGEFPRAHPAPAGQESMRYIIESIK